MGIPSATALPADRPGTSPTTSAHVSARSARVLAPAAVAVVAVALQIIYPLARSNLRAHLTVAIVIDFALACVLHAAVTRGVRRAGLVLLVTAVPGLIIEIVGVHTATPFGSYHYAGVLGPRLFDVPLVIGLAWTMMSWPAALVARRLVAGRLARVLLGAWATTAGDLFLDPQMVSAGSWTWRDPHLHLPGMPTVPLSNFAGWLVVTLILSAMLQSVMGDGDDRVGVWIYLWFWAGWTVALAGFLGLPQAALWGAVAMGSVAVPVIAQAGRTRRSSTRQRLIERVPRSRPNPMKRSSLHQSITVRPGHNSPTDDAYWPHRISAHVASVNGLLSREIDLLCDAWASGGVDRAGCADQFNPPMQLRALLARGGKRTRPVMTLLGWAAADIRGEHRGHDEMVRASAALELLHCLALVHDDVMDESPTRRGVPTVHDDAARKHRRSHWQGSSGRFGDSVAMLVGDLAHSEADRLAATLPEAMRRVWQDMVLELIAGQLNDIVGAAAADRRVPFARLVARQKTGYYTVARPLQLGAAAADASDDALSALADYGRHAGEAFALRDDMLGAFGDPRVTGKPAGDDIRSGKPTVLLALAAESLTGAAAIALRAAGSPDMSAIQVTLVQDAMLETGVAAHVESLIEERARDARAALRTAPLTAAGIDQLTRAVDELAQRGR